MPSSLYSTPPPPPPPLPFQTLTLDGSSNLSSSSSSSSYNPSLIIIAAILGAVCLASATIHLLLRFLSPPSPSSSSSPSPSPQLIHRNPSTSSSPDADRRALVDSLPLLHLPADLASSSDCAVCLSRFRPGDELRFLPACRHAFHSLCIDAWLRSPAASCPLCRSPVHIPSPPSPPPPAAGSSGGPPSVEDPAAGGGGRGWLKEYVDRLSSSASSSFSSRRFSGRWSRRIEGSWDLDEAESGAAASHQWTTSGGITVN